MCVAIRRESLGRGCGIKVAVRPGDGRRRIQLHRTDANFGELAVDGVGPTFAPAGGLAVDAIHEFHFAVTKNLSLQAFDAPHHVGHGGSLGNVGDLELLIFPIDQNLHSDDARCGRGIPRRRGGLGRRGAATGEEPSGDQDRRSSDGREEW